MQSARNAYASRMGATASALDQKPESRAVFRQQFLKTELCRYYRGGCVKGLSCCFAHGESELRVAPDLAKTSLCQAWVDHRCPLTAEACQFAHGWSEMRTTPAFVEYGARQSKKGAPQTASSCGASTANGETGSMAEPPSRPQRRTARRSASSAEPGLQTGGDASTSASGSSQASPTVQHVGFDARAAGQPVVLVRQPESDGVHTAIMLQPWGAVLGEVPLLPLQLTAGGILQPQVPHHLPDDQAMEVLLRQAMPDHYDD